MNVRPQKCGIGMEEVTFLWRQLGRGQMTPVPALVKKIQEAGRPEAKRQVRSFLGLAGYCREFIPHFANICAPLTDLTKKGGPNRVKWLEEHEVAFTKLKGCLTAYPVLKIPDLE